MKNILLFIIWSISSIGFSQTTVDILLVNSMVGLPGANLGLPGNTSTDTGLNQIFQNNNVVVYEVKGGHPNLDYEMRIAEVTCNCDHNALINDLLQYPSVVEDAWLSQYGIFSDALVAYVNDPQTSYPTGIENDIIITNNLALNQIFVNHNVYLYQQHLPNGSGNLLNYYSICCDCDANLLKTDLEALGTMTVENAGAAYLNNPEIELTKTSVYPNPFSSTFTIDTKDTITGLAIIDGNGKQIFRTNSQSVLDKNVSSLPSGIYFLKIQTKDGKEYSHKLIKK